jgi:hypothetical protein
MSIQVYKLVRPLITQSPCTFVALNLKCVKKNLNCCRDIMSSQAVTDLHLEDLPGIKPVQIAKLKRIGIESVLELAVAIPQELAEESGDNLESMSILVIEARKALTNIGLISREFCSAAEILKRRNEILRCTTGSKSLDGLLNGGIEIDSIISLHRAEFSGRQTLWDRQQRLNSILHRLSRLAEVYNIAFILTNQVQSSPDAPFTGDLTKVTGGNIMAHATTYRIFFRKAGHNRIAVMQDSPYHEYGSVKFTITEKGIQDAD